MTRRVPSGLNATLVFATAPAVLNERISFPSTASQTLIVLSFPVVAIRLPSRLNVTPHFVTKAKFKLVDLLPAADVPYGGVAKTAARDPFPVRTEFQVRDPSPRPGERDRLVRLRLIDRGSVERNRSTSILLCGGRCSGACAELGVRRAKCCVASRIHIRARFPSRKREPPRSGLNAALSGRADHSVKVSEFFQLGASQTVTAPFTDARRCRQHKTTSSTSPRWALRVRKCLQFGAFHNLTVRSSLPEAMSSPSGLYTNGTDGAVTPFPNWRCKG